MPPLRFPGVRFHNVGRARATGVRAALDAIGGPADGVWIASTDADSSVRPDWLAYQAARAAEGWDAVIGTVTVDRWPAGQADLADRYRAVVGELQHLLDPDAGVPQHLHRRPGPERRLLLVD
ncbi:hypothetical protein GCM10010264_63340 [Streptomyces globisporus]|nr:hypothetical protein GCM10010264_63340 [Streptomyces globisporus]